LNFNGPVPISGLARGLRHGRVHAEQMLGQDHAVADIEAYRKAE